MPQDINLKFYSRAPPIPRSPVHDEDASVIAIMAEAFPCEPSPANEVALLITENSEPA